MTHPRGTKLDVPALVVAIETICAHRRISIQAALREAGVSPDLMTRLRKGEAPRANTLMALLSWTGLPAEKLMRASTSDDPESDSDTDPAPATAGAA